MSAPAALAAVRYRRARWAALANVASKGMGMLVTIATVKLTVPYLGADRFGAWMLLASLTTMLSFMDLGVGNALTNRTANAAAKDDPGLLRTTISGGLLTLLGLGAGAALLLAATSAVLPWQFLLTNGDPELAEEARSAALVLSLFFGLALFSGGVQKVFLGIQRSFEAHIAMAVASAVSLVLLYLAARQQAGITTLLAVTAASQAIAAVGLMALLMSRGLFRWRGALASAQQEWRQLLRVGGLFLLLQVGTMVGWGADNLIVSATLGSAEVAVYAVVQRLFMFATMPAAMLNQPLWGAYADAHARGDRPFIARTLRRSLLFTALGTGTLAATLVFFSDTVIASWTGDTLSAPGSFVVVFALWALVESLATAASMYMNGCHIIRPQVFAVGVFCALSIPLKMLLAQHFGLTGVVACTVLAYMIAVPVLYSLFFRAAVTAPLRKPSHEA